VAEHFLVGGQHLSRGEHHALARAMMGKGAGEEIEAGATEATITAISV
jgi:hypothetical protein